MRVCIDTTAFFPSFGQAGMQAGCLWIGGNEPLLLHGVHGGVMDCTRVTAWSDNIVFEMPSSTMITFVNGLYVTR